MHSVATSHLRWTALRVVAICVLLPGCQEWPSGQQQEGVDQTARTVFALGHLRPATGIIEIRATPGDRLKTLAEGVVENELIPTSGILGSLDSYDMGKAQLLALEQKKQLASQKYRHQKQLAAAQLAQANASQAQALAKQKEVALQESKLKVLEEAVWLETTEFEKLTHLWADDPELVTDHQLAKQKNKLDLTTEDFRIANMGYASAKKATDLAVESATASCQVAELVHRQASQVFSSQLETKLIDQEIEVAKEALKRSVLLAPQYSAKALDKLISVTLPKSSENALSGNNLLSGAAEVAPDMAAVVGSNNSDTGSGENRPDDPARYRALKIFLHDGEIITQAPIMQLGNLSNMVCIAEVYDADRKELHLNQNVVIRSPAFSGYFADSEIIDSQSQLRRGGILGQVMQIGRMVAPPGLASRNPLAPADRSVIEVQIAISDEANRKAVDVAKKMLEAQGKTLNAEWDENANAHAAKNVGLQVTVEFISASQSPDLEDKASANGDAESGKK